MQDYNLWVLIKPSVSLKGQWVAHCLELDVVSQGNSLAHALQMAAEAVSLVVADDLSVGRNPTDRRAPEEYWKELHSVIEHGSFALSEIELTEQEENVSAVAAQILLRSPPEASYPRAFRPALAVALYCSH